MRLRLNITEGQSVEIYRNDIVFHIGSNLLICRRTCRFPLPYIIYHEDMSEEVLIHARSLRSEKINGIVVDILQSLYILTIASTYSKGVDTLGCRATPIGRHYTRGDVGCDSETEITIDGIYRLILSFKHTNLLVVSVA